MYAQICILVEYSADNLRDLNIFGNFYSYFQWLYPLDLDCIYGLTYLSQRHVFIDV